MPPIATAVLALFQLAMPPEPNFSGQWRLVSAEPPDANATRAMTVEQSVRRTDVFGKPMAPHYFELLVTRDVATGPPTERHLIGVIGGRVSGSASRVGAGGAEVPRRTWREQHSVKWEGRTLVIEREEYTGPESQTGEWSKRREEWSFDADGRLRVVVTTRSSQDPAESSVTCVYRRLISHDQPGRHRP